MINYQVTKDGFMLRVKFFANGDEWKRALSIVKTLKGARWNALDKAWMVQDISENVDKLKSTGTINAPKTEVKKTEKPKDDIPAALKRCPAKYREFALAPELVTDVDLKERQKKLIANTELAGPLVKGLRNYQINFLRFMTAREGRAMLGDDMGTGKTLQSLSWLAYADDFPALIVVTAPTKLQWEREYKRWLNGFKNSEEITILSGRPSIFAKSFSELEKHEHFILKESIDKKSKKKIAKKIPFHEGQVAAVISDENFLPVKLSSLYTWNDRKKIWVYFKPITSSSSSVIINWDILDDWLPLLYKYNFKCIIGDEAQAIGNPTSQRGKAFLKLSKKIPHCIVMSGTPARSRPAQYWSMISCVEPNMFPDYTAYLWRYCDPKFTPFSMQPTFDGARNVKELHAKLMKCMLRRTKDEVMTELPKKQIEVVPLEVDPEIKKAYDGEESMLEAITDKNELRMKVASLNRCAYLMKEKALIKWTEELLEQTGEKVVIFCWHRDVVDLLLEAFAKYNPAKIYGGLSLKEREVEKAKFIEDPSCRVIVGNIQALGTGVDGLQKVCCKAIFAEFANTVTDGRQAEDRLHRGGQEKQVTIYYTLAQGTIDEDMMAALDEKAKILDSVLDGKEVEDIDLLTEILARRGIIK